MSISGPISTVISYFFKGNDKTWKRKKFAWFILIFFFPFTKYVKKHEFSLTNINENFPMLDHVLPLVLMNMSNKSKVLFSWKALTLAINPNTNHFYSYISDQKISNYPYEMLQYQTGSLHFRNLLEFVWLWLSNFSYYSVG